MATYSETRGPRIRRTVRRGWYTLLLVQFVALLYPGFYAHERPEVWGIPFFYWYQFLWVVIGALLNWVVYAVTTRSERLRPGTPTTEVNREVAG